MTVAAAADAAPAPSDAPPKSPEHNRLGLDFRRPMPRPKVRGVVIDWHTHLLAKRHAPAWFEAADHYGFDKFVTMTPLEEAVSLYRDWPDRLHFIAIPRWQETGPSWHDEWLRRIESFYNLGSRIVKFHMAPGTMAARTTPERKWRLDSTDMRRLMDEAVARGMILMSHVGDPDTWYHGKYAADPAKFGTRDEHYRMW